MRVVVLGAGFGGLELTTRLSEELGDDVDVVLIDQSRRVRLRVLEARRDVRASARRRGAPPLRATSSSPACGSCRRPCTSIDPVAKRVETDAGTFDADILVVALGADLRPGGDARAARGGPRVLHGGRRLRAAATCSTGFDGGRVIVGVTSTPFKCPPAPSETALLMHDYLVERGAPRSLGDRARHAAARADPAVAGGVGGAARRRSPSAASPGIPEQLVRELDPAAQGRRAAPTAARCPSTCSSASRCTGCPTVVAAVGHDRRRLDPGRPADARDRRFPDVYAVGDVTSVGTPKAGVFAEGQAAVVADAIIAAVARRDAASPSTTAAGSATSSSATTRSPRSTSRS